MSAQIISAQVAEIISTKIKNGEYKPHEKLPNEKELMDMYDASRGTIREAIKILTSKGIVEIQRGNGTFVCGLVGVSEDPFGLRFLTQDSMVNGLLELRYLLEPGVTEIAAVRATEEEIKCEKKISDELEKLTRQLVVENSFSSELIDKIASLDIAFHNAFFKMCHNEVLERMMPAISTPLFQVYSSETFIQYYIHASDANEHQLMFNALESRDGKALRLLDTRHIENLINHIKHTEQF